MTDLATMAGSVPDDDYEELRLGLVLNGGVSLAVWMGGVTTEIDRLRLGDGGYGDVLQLLASRARVDVIAGASAGGINGGLLATAIAHDRALSGLRRLWVSRGGLSSLLRSPFASDPPSLMDGDGYFRRSLGEGLAAVAGAAPAVRERGGNVHLTMVMSVLSGVSRGLADDFGSVIPDASHVGTFTFARDARHDDWGDPQALDRIALAARCSASFPFAFEPSFVPVNHSQPAGDLIEGRPNMAGFVDFPSSRYTVDGGALMNKPFLPALDAIYAQPATTQVRRVLIYVAPDPGAARPDQPDAVDERPGLARTVLDSVMTMPRNESVGRELAEIRAHNDAVANFRLVREGMYESDPTVLAGSLFEVYLSRRASVSVDNILRGVDRGAFSLRLPPGRIDRNALRRQLIPARKRCMPTGLPAVGADPSTQPWQWGINTVETVAMTALDLLKRALNMAPVGDRATRAGLREARGRVHEQRAVLGAIRKLDDGFWEEEAARAHEPGWADEVFDRWAERVDARAAAEPRIGEGVFDALAARATAVASVLVEVRPLMVKAAAGSGGRDAERLAAGVASLVPRRRTREASVRDCLRSLLAMEVVLTAFTAAAPTSDQLLELMLVSGDTPNAFDSRQHVPQKLTGVNLGHFAAFYKASWRANDWMFGRLDGAWRLCQVLLSPVRLRQLFAGRPDDAWTAVEAAALGTATGHPESPDVRAYLADPAGHWDPERARRELDFLDDPAAPLPLALPACARGVARRLQLGILIDELPSVADAIRKDIAARASFDSGGDFMVAYPPSPDRAPLPARTAVELFGLCEVGTETIAGEFGTDLLTSTVSTVAAVTVNATGGAELKLGPLGAVLASVRVFTTVLAVLSQSVVRRSRSGFAVVLLLLTLGGLVLVLPFISSDVDPPLPLTLLGAAALAAGALLAWLRSGAPWSGFLMLGATAAGFAAPLVFLRKPVKKAEGALAGWDAVLYLARPVLAVAALIVVPWVISAVARRRRRRPAPIG